MTHKVYLITHLDNGMKYVGYTSKDLRTRWQQHCNDPKSAVYDAIRREGYRMTMELLGEFDTKIEALRKEQEYIRTLNTLAPNGWNVQEREIPEPETKPAPKKWEERIAKIDLSSGTVLICPSCGFENLHQKHVHVYFRDEDCTTGIHSYTDWDSVYTDTSMRNNPSLRRQGIIIGFTCEQCHGDEFAKDPPVFQLQISQHKGETYLLWHYYIEDKS